MERKRGELGATRATPGTYFRLEPDLLDLMDRLAKRLDCNRTEVVRRAVHAYAESAPSKPRRRRAPA